MPDVFTVFLNKDDDDDEMMMTLPRRGRGGGGYSTNVYTGRLRPEVQPLTLLYTIFHEKSTPFVWYPSHIPCLELCTPSNCCKCSIF